MDYWKTSGVGALSEPPTHFKPMNVGQVDIEQDDICALRRKPQRLLSRCSFAHIDPAPLRTREVE